MQLARSLPAMAPVLIATSFILTVFADSGDVLDQLPRPLLVAIAVAGLMQLGATAITRSVTWGAVIAGLVVATAIEPRFLFVAAGVTLGWLVARWRGVRLNLAAAAIVPVMLFAISSFRVVTSEAFAVSDLIPGNTIHGQQAAGPSIYLILLDGYPRADTLASFGFDNRPFIGELGARGFDASERSHGSYPFTAQVITAMLNMAHLPDIDSLTPAPKSQAGQARALAAAVRSNPALTFLEQHGYRTLSTGLPATVLTLRGVDEYLDPGVVTMFEHQVLRRTALWGWLDGWALAQLRSQVDGTFETVERVATTADDPTFLFAHVMAPHTPFVFDRDGRMPRLSCDPDCERWTIFPDRMPLPVEEYEAAYVEQVRYVNGRVLDTVDTIIASDPAAVVIVFSDHGTRADPADMDEWYRTLFAARTLDHPDLYGEQARPIDIFPRLFGAYFGEEVPIAPQITYTAHPDLGLQYPLDVD